LTAREKKIAGEKKFLKEGLPMSQFNFIFKKLSYLILKFAFSVHNLLGPGLLESAYEGAFCVELTQSGIPFERQKVYPLYYKGSYIGAYIADLVVDNKVIVELKSVVKLTDVMAAQLINYLKLSHIQVGYLMNFNSLSLEWKRFVNQVKGA
jgi:GxxExxY protein